MKKRIFIFSITRRKELLIILCIFLLQISCSKEYSYEGGFTPVPVSIFTNQIPSNQTINDMMGAIEVGTKFISAKDGTVIGIKFYKSPGNIGTHTVQLYNYYGAPLG